jgi:hypothetical protein
MSTISIISNCETMAGMSNSPMLNHTRTDKPLPESDTRRLDLLYSNVDCELLRYNYKGHGYLLAGLPGHRYIPTEYCVEKLTVWPPIECHPDSAADYLILQSAIEAGISDPFVWLDSRLFVTSRQAAGWLNVDLALEHPSPTTRFLGNTNRGQRAYNYDHYIPVVIAHSLVHRLLELYTAPELLSYDVKTLLLNLDPERQGRPPIWLDSLYPVYQHFTPDYQETPFPMLARPLFFTVTALTSDLREYVQD